MIFTICNNATAGSERAECLSTMQAVYPDLVVIDDLEAPGINPVFPGIIKSDIKRMMILRDNPGSLYLDSDMVLQHEIVISDPNKLGLWFEYGIFNNCVIYSPLQRSDLFDDFIQRFSFTLDAGNQFLSSMIVQFSNENSLLYEVQKIIPGQNRHLMIGWKSRYTQ